MPAMQRGIRPMSSMDITCPACGAGYRLQQQRTLVLCQCSACQHEFYLDVDGQLLPATTAPMPAQETASEDVVSTPQDSYFDLKLSELSDAGILDPAAEPESETTADETAEPEPASASEANETPAPADDAPAAVPPVVDPLPVENDEKAVPVATPAEEQPIITPPKRRKHRIWPWLLMLLLALAAAGLWVQREAWIHHPVVRSVLLKTGLSHLASESDWWVDEQNITMHWERAGEGKTPVLVFEGQVENRLHLPLPLPRFEAVFADAPEQPHTLYSVASQHLAEAIAANGQIRPEWYDQRPVAAGESRHFILVLHGLDARRALRVSLRAVPGD